MDRLYALDHSVFVVAGRGEIGGSQSQLRISYPVHNSPHWSLESLSLPLSHHQPPAPDIESLPFIGHFTIHIYGASPPCCWWLKQFRANVLLIDGLRDSPIQSVSGRDPLLPGWPPRFKVAITKYKGLLMT